MSVESDLAATNEAALLLHKEVARLEVRIAEVERERDHYRYHFDQQQVRAEALEGALRAIREEFRSPSSPTGYDGDPVEIMAAAALADEPYADVPGAGQRGCG